MRLTIALQPHTRRLGLGLPWLLASGFVYKTPSKVDTGSLWAGIGFLFGVLLCLVALLACTKWQLNQRVGVTLLFLYFLFVTFELFVHCHISGTCDELD